MYPRLHVGAVLLAAGEGRRMGGVAKPLIRLQGVPLISRPLIDNNPGLVHIHETGITHFITDLDTADDLDALAERTGWRLEMPA